MMTNWCVGFLAFLLAGIVVAARYIIWTAASGIYVQPIRPNPADERRRSRFWFAAVFTVLCVGLGVPMRVSFLLARPGLLRIMSEVGDDPNVPKLKGTRRVGLYTIDLIYSSRAADGSVTFRFVGGDGFVYSPAGIGEHCCFNWGSNGRLWPFWHWYWFSED
jgi:hypothetical protein